MRKLPLGQQIHLALVQQGRDGALAIAQAAGQPDLFDRVNVVASEQPIASFLHSALCAMSLPVRRPVDEMAPILRQDGQYTLAITPKPVLLPGPQGQQQLAVLGVPFGSLPRLILIHIMTEAVRGRSRRIRLGASFSDWMRRMGYQQISYGPRGSATLIRQQLDRLLACEWMIRWDNEDAQGTREFGIKEIKLTNEYVGTDTPGGGFLREILLTESFFDHLREHAVPLNEHAIRQLRDSATALDLYTWLAYRLPRITSRRPAILNWQQVAVHFGNDGANIRKFRQTIRDAWDRQVSGVYPEARVEFDTTVVRLHPSPPPLSQTVVTGARLHIVDPSPLTLPATESKAEQFLRLLRSAAGEADARAWLRDARIEGSEQDLQLVVATRFKADWIRSRFVQALEEISRSLGVRIPTVVARSA